MKQIFTILLAVMLVVFTLTACGRNNDQPQQNTTNDPVTGSDTQNGDYNNQENGALDNNGVPTEPENGTAGTQNGIMDGSAGDDGVSFGQMLDNGNVNDSDGLLNDGENAVNDVVTGTENAVNDAARGTRNAANDALR